MLATSTTIEILNDIQSSFLTMKDWVISAGTTFTAFFLAICLIGYLYTKL